MYVKTQKSKRLNLWGANSYHLTQCDLALMVTGILIHPANSSWQFISVANQPTTELRQQ